MRSVVDITLDVSVGVTGFAHLVCGLLIREGITTAAELGSELEKQARRSARTVPSLMRGC